MIRKEHILEHFQNRWADFYAHFVELPPAHNGSAKIRSPFRADDRTPSFQINFDGEFAGRWHDYGTGTHGDAFDFFARLRGIQAFPEVMQAIAQEFGLADPAPKKPEGPKPVKTLAQRGISEATAHAFEIREDASPGRPDRSVSHCIIYPVRDIDKNVIGFKIHKGKHLKAGGKPAGKGEGVKPQLYPWKALQHEAVYLVNGEPGVWRCWEAGHRNAICGTSGEGIFKTEWAEHFQGKAVRLTLDNDDIGREGMAKIAKMLHGVAASVELVQWPDDFPAKGDVEDWLNAGHRLEELTFVLYEPAPSDGASDLSTGPYRIENGRIGYMKTIGRGDDSTEMFSPLCNFTARVAEEVIRDDGVETQRVFAIEGVLDDGRPLSRTEVSANQFVNMGWTVGAWGTKARIVAGQSAKDRLREAIQIFSSDVKEHTVYTHTGWRRSGGEWIYLHAGGAIGATDIEVSLESPLDRYCLPDVAEDVAGAVGVSLGLLDVAPHSVTYPLFASVMLAPLSHLLHPDFGLWVLGSTGLRKSSLCALFLSHYGDFPDKTALPASWESTENALEKRLFTLKDVPCVIDDYAPKADPSAQAKMSRIAQRIVRAQGNLSGRSRMRADTTLRPDYPPRGLMISTGEDLPPGESILARLLTIELTEAVDSARLTPAQEQAHRLPHAMAGYLEWLAPQMDALAESLPRRFRALRVEAVSCAAHPRTPEIVAYLTMAFDLYLKFAVHVGAISDDAADRLYSNAWDTLLESARIHDRRTKQEDPAERFLNVLSGLFASESAYVERRGVSRLPDEYKPAGNMIGWADEDFYYLLPDATRAAIASALRSAGEHWPHSQNALYRALEKRGVIARGEDGRSLTQIKEQGKKSRVLKIGRMALDPVDE